MSFCARIISAMMLCFVLAGCGMKTEDAEKPIPNWLKGTNTIEISWEANKELSVTQAGGGYRVYIGNKSGFSLSDAPYYDVPYDDANPLKTQIKTLTPGTYYVGVARFKT